jgi:hypothetical protein
MIMNRFVMCIYTCRSLVTPFRARPRLQGVDNWSCTAARAAAPLFLDPDLAAISLVDHMGFRTAMGVFSPLDISFRRSLFQAAIAASANYTTMVLAWDAELLRDQWWCPTRGKLSLSGEWMDLLAFIREEVQHRGKCT